MEQEKFYNKDGKEITRQRCEIYTRVMGYYRPVSQFNEGKKSEHYSRTHFTEESSIYVEDRFDKIIEETNNSNSDFISEFGD